MKNIQVEIGVRGYIIDQKISTEVEGIQEVIRAHMIDTMEQQIWQALVSLGWTPPEDHPCNSDAP